MSRLFSAVGTSVPPWAGEQGGTASLRRMSKAHPTEDSGRCRKPSTDVEGAPNKGLAE